MCVWMRWWLGAEGHLPIYISEGGVLGVFPSTHSLTDLSLLLLLCLYHVRWLLAGYINQSMGRGEAASLSLCPSFSCDVFVPWCFARLVG